MITFAPVLCLRDDNSTVHGRIHHDPVAKSMPPLRLVTMFAASATAVSLGISTYGGWQRGGTLTEQVMSVALGGVAVFCTHLLPMCWKAFRPLSRGAAFVLWCVSLVVALYGQITFFMVSQQHAGNQRAAAIPATVVRPSMNLPPGRRTLTEIARDTAKVGADLAHAEVRRCVADCSVLKARKAILAAQLAALDTEASEVRRREAEEDLLNAQADRAETLRATLRADPVASTVASWFGTTERRLELMLAVACAVVLEGAAVMAWLLVPIASRHVGTREAVVSARRPEALKHDAVALGPEAVAGMEVLGPDDRTGDAACPPAVTPGQAVLAAEGSDRVSLPEDELLLDKIHQAVLTGQIKATQESIRRFLRCRQPKAGSLNRQYLARHGNARSKEGRTESAMSAPNRGESLHISPDMLGVHQEESNARMSGVVMPAVAGA